MGLNIFFFFCEAMRARKLKSLEPPALEYLKVC